MTVGCQFLALFALTLGIVAGLALEKLAALRTRPPRTDQEHAQNVHRRAYQLNLALGDARAAGLNPAVKVSPIDPDILPGLRPFIATVERGGVTVER